MSFLLRWHWEKLRKKLIDGKADEEEQKKDEWFYLEVCALDTRRRADMNKREGKTRGGWDDDTKYSQLSIIHMVLYSRPVL